MATAIYDLPQNHGDRSEAEYWAQHEDPERKAKLDYAADELARWMQLPRYDATVIDVDAFRGRFYKGEAVIFWVYEGKVWVARPKKTWAFEVLTMDQAKGALKSVRDAQGHLVPTKVKWC